MRSSHSAFSACSMAVAAAQARNVWLLDGCYTKACRGIAAVEGRGMAQTASETAASIMCVIAVEQHFPPDRRLLDDPLAVRFLPLGMRVFVRMVRSPGARDWFVSVIEKLLPGLWSGLACRKRYIDDAVIAGVGRGLAVVSLGAGLDTRAYRMPALVDVPIWEVDQAANIDQKRRRLVKVFGSVPPRRTLVPVDFAREDLAAALAAHGYALDRPTFFIMEAVSQYLSESAVRTTFELLAKAPHGSRLAFTYVRKGFLGGEVAEAGSLAHDEFVKTNTWSFGLDPGDVASFVGDYGWDVLEHVGTDELAPRYVTSMGRSLTPSTVERIVIAERRSSDAARCQGA